MPAVLLEMGFINHSRDRARIQEAEYQSSVAKAITQAVKRYYQQ
jgi:N-acetylmuramoyl-L-alanine amidase